MTEAAPEIVVVAADPLPPGRLAGLVAAWFEDMVKYVVDVGRGEPLP